MNKRFVVGDIISDKKNRFGIILAVNNNCTKSIIMWFQDDLDFWYDVPRTYKVRAALNMDNLNIVPGRWEK